MTGFVLDNSVTMRWLLASTKDTDQAYAIKVLKSLSEHQAVVPNLWHLEVVNVLLGAEKHHTITAGLAEDFLIQLESLPLRIDTLTPLRAFSRSYGLARSYHLSSYDAAYLELAIREGLALATLDKDLASAAKKANVPLYLVNT